MSLRPSDYRFWLMLAALAVGLLAACSSDDSTNGGAPSPGPGGSGGVSEASADALSHT
jgi:hypothetical protein